MNSNTKISFKEFIEPKLRYKNLKDKSSKDTNELFNLAKDSTNKRLELLKYFSKK